MWIYRGKIIFPLLCVVLLTGILGLGPRESSGQKDDEGDTWGVSNGRPSARRSPPRASPPRRRPVEDEDEESTGRDERAEEEEAPPPPRPRPKPRTANKQPSPTEEDLTPAEARKVARIMEKAEEERPVRRRPPPGMRGPPPPGMGMGGPPPDFDRPSSESRALSSTRTSHTLRRAAKLPDLEAGLAENYEYDPQRNRTLRRVGPGLYLNDADYAASAMGHLPDTDLTAYDAPRSGYPLVTAFAIDEGPAAPARKISAERLKSNLEDALGYGRQDLRTTVFSHRPLQCIVGDYGHGAAVNPLTWIVAQPNKGAEYAYVNELAAKRLANGLMKGAGEELYSTIRRSGITQDKDSCYLPDDLECNKKSPYRTFDGSCNNLGDPSKGAALTGSIHTIRPAYEDGIAAPRDYSVTSLIKKELKLLPSAREVSITLGRGQIRQDRKTTALTMQFGQFVAHDLVNTPVDLVENPEKKGDYILPACCHVEKSCRHPSCYPISIPFGDPFYGQFRKDCMEFIRSQPANPRTCDLAPRRPVNINSHFLDASPIYGSNLATSMMLRGPRGTLKTGHGAKGAPKDYVLPPAGPDTMSCHGAGPDMPCMMSGDSRTNQHTGMISMIALFIREHNRIAKYIAHEVPDMPDEAIFQVARRIVAAELQHITYNELLPVLLGPKVYKEPANGLALTEYGFCKDCYMPNEVDPSTSVEFVTGAFRLHTLAPDYLPGVRNASGGRPPYWEHMLNPEMFYRPNIVDDILQGFVKQAGQGFDPFLASQLQNHLFQMRNKPYGQDMHSFNIQRGRDHGVPSYADVRAACGLPPVATFSELEDLMPARAIKQLASVYEHVLDIDFYAGGISEFSVNGGDGLVGPTFACIIADQFARTKHGDRFWYENKEAKFTKEQLEEIRKVSLSVLLCGNAKIQQIQPRALLQDSPRNPVLPCDVIMSTGGMSLAPFIMSLDPDKFPSQPAEYVERSYGGEGPGRSRQGSRGGRRGPGGGYGGGPSGGPGGPGFGPGGPDYGPVGPGGPGGPGFGGPGGPDFGPGGVGPGGFGPGEIGPGGPLDGPGLLGGPFPGGGVPIDPVSIGGTVAGILGPGAGIYGGVAPGYGAIGYGVSGYSPAALVNTGYGPTGDGGSYSYYQGNNQGNAQGSTGTASTSNAGTTGTGKSTNAAAAGGTETEAAAAGSNKAQGTAVVISGSSGAGTKTVSISSNSNAPFGSASGDSSNSQASSNSAAQSQNAF
ncbi:hypothetical protein RvY_01122 [Ramazzottius varieornatus]|uniref:Uncharacterized protein n=1 Tax=Ramazzottius varieornatus TaxID=947166 RepID=A0A1D1UMC8_RAMVA|nr:hypothetical protein RvY_01122 [Ramazzottius varieornatus]